MQENAFESVIYRMVAILSQPQYVNRDGFFCESVLLRLFQEVWVRD